MATVSRKKDCRHLGAQLRLTDCPTCSGRVQVKVFACEVYGECTLAKKVDDLGCCQTCEYYEPRTDNETPQA